MPNNKHTYQPASPATKRPHLGSRTMLVGLGLLGAVSGCRTVLPLDGQVNAQVLPSATPSQTATATPSPHPPPATPTASPSPTITPWPTPTVWPSPTPWPSPAAWQPAAMTMPVLSTLSPLPVSSAPGATFGGLTPVSYGPPDGVDVFGNVILHWEYGGSLAPDEWFDIKIKPLGSNDSVFVDWSKSNSYELRPWSGWQAGLYTWQIGIVQGTLVDGAKHFIADTGRDSSPLTIKWQAAAGGGGGGAAGGSGAAGGGGSSGGS